MARSRSQIIEAVCQQFGQDSFAGGYEGPVRAGPFIIHRVWTEEGKGADWDCHAHYAVEVGEELLAFEDFAPFGAWLSDAFDLDKFAARREQLIKIFVASFVVLGAFAVFAFTALRNPDEASLGYIATAIIGGGAGFLFGNWSRR